MGDYYNGINREEDEQIKLRDTVYDWWENLTEEKQYKIISNWCPEDITEETDADDMFGNMLWNEQYEIYKVTTAVEEDYRKDYKDYLQVLDDREKAGRKPISFDDYLWSQAEKAIVKNISKQIRGI